VTRYKLPNKLNKTTRVQAGCFFVSGVFLISSCVKNIYDNRPLSEKLVVLSEITAGDTVNIPIGATVAAGSGDTIVFTKLTAVNANIVGQDGLNESLSLNVSPDFSLDPMAVYSGNQILGYQTSYTLTATDPLLGMVQATTIIPNDFSVQQTEAGAEDFNNSQAFRFAFILNDAADEKNYYIFEAVKQLANISNYFYWQGVKYDYSLQQNKDLFQQVRNNAGVTLLRDTILSHQYIRLNVYTRDTKSGNASLGSLDSAYSRIFISDSLFNGQSYETQFWISMDHFYATSPQDYQGVVQIQVKSVSKELYDYLFMNEKYKQEFGNFNVTNLTSPVGNIQNGFGVFGGSVRKQWSYYDQFQ
jgi:hypothetical protein